MERGTEERGKAMKISHWKDVKHLEANETPNWPVLIIIVIICCLMSAWVGFRCGQDEGQIAYEQHMDELEGAQK
jgi:hypothetical protein